MAIQAKFSTKAVSAVAASRNWQITIPPGAPIWASIDPLPAGGVRKNVESALLQPGQTYTFQSDPVDLFLSVLATDPAADATPVAVAVVDAGAVVAQAIGQAQADVGL